MRQKAQLPRGWKNCLNCFSAFKPRAQKVEEQKFCSPNCRKEFWKHGGVSVHKLKLEVRKWVAEVCAPLRLAVDQLIARVDLIEAKQAQTPTAQPKLRNGLSSMSQTKEANL